MRLRPSGSKGPVASERRGFLRYQRHEAWTWEHMALTRARILAAPPYLHDKLKEKILEVLVEPREEARLARDVVEMRERIAAEHRTDDPWDVKHARGGIVDIEFIAQYLQLFNAARHPEILSPRTIKALKRLAHAGCLDQADASALIKAVRLQGRVQGIARLTLAERKLGDTIPRALQDLLAAVTETRDLAHLRQKLEAAQAEVRERFARLIEAPAARAEISSEEGVTHAEHQGR
jgi:glutamate-ammonia-ligase adenylyltransferase